LGGVAVVKESYKLPPLSPAFVAENIVFVGNVVAGKELSDSSVEEV
jgi:hypothetical protein